VFSHHLWAKKQKKQSGGMGGELGRYQDRLLNKDETIGGSGRAHEYAGHWDQCRWDQCSMESMHLG